MVYISLNDRSRRMRETPISKRVRQDKLDAGQRFEFQKGMYGNVYQITDHERKVFYRQDQEIIEQLNLLDEKLPRYCDYCNSTCDDIDQIKYQAVYEMIVRPKTNPEIKRDTVEITYAACADCSDRNEVPKGLIKGYIVRLYQSDKLIWKRNVLHHDDKLIMPWVAI